MFKAKAEAIRGALGGALLAGALLLPSPGHAQPGGADPQALEVRHAASAEEYERIAREITLSDERAAEIAAEIASLRDDAAAVSAALVQAAKTERKLTQDAADIGARLATLGRREATLRASLDERRGVLAEVLAALQRMGLNPPPAILVTPEDVLASVRSSILLGAVVPDLRAETDILIGDLEELGRIVASIEREKERLEETAQAQAEEKSRLSLLLEEKRRMQATSEELLQAERARAETLAAEATSLRELIEALEADLEMARLEAERAGREAAEARAALPESAATPSLQPGAVPFSAMTRQVSLPAAGRIARRFGEDDGHGTIQMGDTVATHSGAIVTAPADGVVLYAGPFRSYGRLLILDAGDGYHVVLAGMGGISVSRGQAVLAGEPVGVMDEMRTASVGGPSGDDPGSENSGTELYVEFRSQGRPVDPAPWWAERNSGRTGNDT